MKKPPQAAGRMSKTMGKVQDNTKLSPLQQFCNAYGEQRFIFLKNQGIAIDLEECKDILLLQAAAYQTAKDLAVALASAQKTLTWFGKFRKELAQ